MARSDCHRGAPADDMSTRYIYMYVDVECGAWGAAGAKHRLV
jgi:hypothetical protein